MRKSLGGAARQYIAENLSDEAVGRELGSILDDLEDRYQAPRAPKLPAG